MKTDGRETNRSLEDQFDKQKIDTSRRSLTKAGVFAPILMTLTSKTALGSTYQCVISGMQSGNVSGHSEDLSVCASGYTAVQWQDVDNADNRNSSTAHPNIFDWITAGINPFRVEKITTPQGTPNDFYYKKGIFDCSAPATIGSDARKMCVAIFNAGSFSTVRSPQECAPISSSPTVATRMATTFDSVFGGGDTASFWDKLYLGSGLEYDASVNYLNAKMGLIPDISPQDVIDLYNLAKNGTPFNDGSMLITNQAGAAALLASLHP